MKQVTPNELKEWMKSDRPFLLIDVREPWEHELFDIGGLLIPLSELASHVNNIPKNKDVVLYCEKGIRSVIAIQRLEAAGFHNLINLSGGMRAWKQAVH
jgi:adenylyltransferase/sulfurtransferase